MSVICQDGAIGFVGLGVMGEPMCRNMARKCGRPLMAYDARPEPLARLAVDGVQAAAGLGELAAHVDVICLVLPSGRHVEDVCTGPDGLMNLARRGTLIVDLGTSPVELTQDLAARFTDKGCYYADAPIARTRQAAEDGTLSIMVGAEPTVFSSLEPLLRTLASDVSLCGPVGSGQMVKILNNMVLVETVVALSEAIAVARSAGLDDRVLLEVLSKGSADSFALRNHGMKAILPNSFPERAFSTDYARKDLSYALALGSQHGVDMSGARNADDLLRKASDQGYGDLYWPVVSRILGSQKPSRG